MPYQRVSHGGGAVPTTLTSSITSGDSALTIDDAAGWPDGSIGPFYVVLGSGLATEEKVLVTSRTGTSLTGVSRGVDGTSASAHAAGETVVHVLSATEADEANKLVAQTLGVVSTKGDLTPATGSGALGRLPAGANGLPLITDSSATTGLKWAALPAAALATDSVGSAQIQANAVGAAELATGAVGTTELADSSVTSIKIADGSVTGSKIANSFMVWGTYSGTTDGNGVVTFAHGAPFTPVTIIVSAVYTSPGTNNARLFNKDATNLEVRYTIDGGGNLTATAVNGSFVVFST